MTTMMVNYNNTRQQVGGGGRLNQTQSSTGYVQGPCHTEMGQVSMGVGTAH